MIKSIRYQTILLGTLIALSACTKTATPNLYEENFMHYDTSSKQVHFELIAAKNANNNGYNYNGYYQNAVTLKVPAGWIISITFINRDANAPHSIVLTPAFSQNDIPDEQTGEFAIINRAYTEVLHANEQETISFPAKEGRYWLFCGVKRHGIDGMWIPLTVERDLQIPALHFRQ